MAVLTQQQVTLGSGLAPSFGAAAGGGDKVQPGPTSFLVVKNGGGSPITVTIDSKVPSNYGTDVNEGGSVPNGSERWYGPLTAQRFGGVDGLVDIAYSGVTSVTVASVRI